MTASTAFNVFARAVVRERKIPFEIVAQEIGVAKDRFKVPDDIDKYNNEIFE